MAKYLLLAAQQGLFDVVERLLALDVSVDLVDEVDGMTSLMVLADKPDTPDTLFTQVLEKTSALNRRRMSKIGKNALEYAAKHRLEQRCQDLIDAGVPLHQSHPLLCRLAKAKEEKQREDSEDKQKPDIAPQRQQPERSVVKQALMTQKGYENVAKDDVADLVSTVVENSSVDALNWTSLGHYLRQRQALLATLDELIVQLPDELRNKYQWVDFSTRRNDTLEKRVTLFSGIIKDPTGEKQKAVENEWPEEAVTEQVELHFLETAESELKGLRTVTNRSYLRCLDYAIVSGSDEEKFAPFLEILRRGVLNQTTHSAGLKQVKKAKVTGTVIINGEKETVDLNWEIVDPNTKDRVVCYEWPSDEKRGLKLIVPALFLKNGFHDNRYNGQHFKLPSLVLKKKAVLSATGIMLPSGQSGHGSSSSGGKVKKPVNPTQGQQQKKKKKKNSNRRGKW